MEDPSFMVLEIDVLSNGTNHHGTEFLTEDIINSIPFISNKPLNCIIQFGDFVGHATNAREEKQQLGIGTIPETNDAKMVEKNGKMFLRLNAIVWKYLYPEASEILKRRKQVAVSMEITPTEIEKTENKVIRIRKWRYEAITLLGTYVKPAIDNAKAVVVKYSSNEEYIDTVMTKYGIFVDCIHVSDKVLECSTNVLSNTINQKSILSIATQLASKNKFTYDEIISLKQELNSVNADESEMAHNFYYTANEWFNSIVKEKQGGQNVDKIKELLIDKFSGNLRYASHDEQKVYCFDYETAQYKAFEYTAEEIDEEINFSVSEECVVVNKLKNSDEFVVELSEGQEVDDEVKYSVSLYSELLNKVSELENNLTAKSNEVDELNTKFSELETEKETLVSEKETLKTNFSALEVEKNELNEKILAFSELDTELNSLREYKEKKEAEIKTTAINSLYSKYNEYLTEDEIATLNDKAKVVDITSFQKEVYSIVTPKIEAKLNMNLSLIKKNEDGSAENLKYTTVPKTEKEEKEDTSLVGRLNRI